jgi:mannose-6-phosphate isomerase-like protein (cupin superfamily)
MILYSRLAELASYTTRDGSEIRELMHPSQQGNRNQSLAEAVVAPGQQTRLHYHRQSEELYHITHGRGRLTLGEETIEVRPGDTICIPPGTPHCILNTGEEALHILCMCAPAYSHDDTVVMGTGTSDE